MSIENALKIIVSKSPKAARDAMQCLQAIRVKSPMAQVRYNRTVEIAMSDHDANFTTEERAIIAEAVELPEGEARGFTLRVRLTSSEQAELQTAADEAGLSMSEYARQKIFD